MKTLKCAVLVLAIAGFSVIAAGCASGVSTTAAEKQPTRVVAQQPAAAQDQPAFAQEAVSPTIPRLRPQYKGTWVFGTRRKGEIQIFISQQVGDTVRGSYNMYGGVRTLEGVHFTGTYSRGDKGWHLTTEVGRVNFWMNGDAIKGDYLGITNLLTLFSADPTP